ncbi:hypothetical protein J2Z44_003583 [Clostridium punense]|uniref:N-acetyltransferase domain-containing protein n=1 Tax=Clostridium punense TaxID=1054297 RepID=A0ABS4K7H0_9CLOT|nr:MULTISPECIES: hypothetical protein [Clostridium]EQB88435.1 hypothetical protein M918_24430 [Clostridium sp. BL8]MBP2023741.1 hypothetical protein [Clostridium punense]
MIKVINKVEEILDFVWKLSQDDFYASYPRRKSLEEVKKYLQRTINEDEKSIVAYYKDNELYGVCCYFWEESEKYAQTTLFLIKDYYEDIAEALISYVSIQLPGYELFIGFPDTNENAREYFEGKSIQCIEASTVTKLYNLKSDIREKHPSVERITESNFDEYAIFHDEHAVPSGMYYNSKNLKKDMELFRVFALREQGKIHGSIFVRARKGMSEIFGLFIDKEYEDKHFIGILINEMLMELYNEFGTVKEIIYFINEGSTEELNSALSAGFEIYERYRCYKCLL